MLNLDRFASSELRPKSSQACAVPGDAPVTSSTSTSSSATSPNPFSFGSSHMTAPFPSREPCVKKGPLLELQPLNSTSCFVAYLPSGLLAGAPSASSPLDFDGFMRRPKMMPTMPTGTKKYIMMSL